MDKNVLYIAEYYIERDVFINKEYKIIKIESNGAMILEDNSIIYQNELDMVEDNGTFIICPSFNERYAANSVIKCYCDRLAESIQKLIREIK